MATNVRNLALIRFALLSGVLLFGAVCWYMAGQRGGGPNPSASPEMSTAFRVLVPALCAVALGVAIVIRSRLARVRDAQQRDSMRMIAWAVGEASALAGGVYYFNSGDPKLYVIGVVAMLATFIIVSIRDS